MDLHANSIGWHFWLRWFAATTMAFVAGVVAATFLSYLVINPFYPKETNLIVGLCVGAATGLAQVVAVRTWVKLSSGWVVGAMIVLGPPFMAAVIVDELIPGSENGSLVIRLTAVTGMLVGSFIQARVLKRYTSRAYLWIVASLIAGGSALFGGQLLGIVAGSLILAALSGAFMMWILKAPNSFQLA